MKKAIKTISAAILILAAAIAVTMYIAYHHRSDPAGLRTYETGNPNITADKTMVSAHRAGGKNAPEETMVAFRKCVEDDNYEVDYFEFDLHITKDDILVLLHDDELDRISDCEEVFGKSNCRPEDYTFEELRKLNMADGFKNEEGGRPYRGLRGDEVPDDIRILDLDTILDYLEGAGDYHYIIEIKNEGNLGKKSMDILYDTLKERNMVDKVVFGCFLDEISEYKDEKYPDLMRGATTKEVAEFYFSCLLGRKNYDPEFGVIQMPFNDTKSDYHFNLGTVSLINYAHAHDIAVQYWTINDEEDASYLISIGADALTTDRPDMVYRLRKSG